MANELFKRRCSVQVGETLIRDLRIAFDVRKSNDKTPNTCAVSIFNLSEDTRKHIEQSKGQPLILTAGYEKSEAIIFSGDVRFASSDISTANIVTKIESGDGETAFSTSAFSKSFGKGTSTKDVIKSVVSSLGVKPGNLDKALATGLKKLTHARGYVASGRASDILDSLLRDHDLTFSVQNGQLQILKRGESIDSFAVSISNDSGMIGSPQINTPQDATKATKAQVKSYLQPQFKVGGLAKVRSASVTGQYLIEKVAHTGDTHGPPWYTTIEITVK